MKMLFYLYRNFFLEKMIRPKAVVFLQRGILTIRIQLSQNIVSRERRSINYGLRIKTGLGRQNSID